MKSIQIEFSKYESVNSLWSELIEHHGFERAKNIVSQAIDLQKMNGNKNVTMPIIFSGTGGLALIPICLLYTSPSPRDRTRSRMPSSA